LRAEYSLRLFQNELRAYSELKFLQGKSIAKFLGYYDVTFPNRELDEDRKVKVLMLGVLHGTLLDETPAVKIKNVDPKQVHANVLDTLQALYRHNIFFPKIGLQKFLISEDDP
jgi:hypothetical protein